MDLRRLDDRVVPLLAERVQAARDTLAASPSAGQVLRELDEQYASTGALRVVRDAPLLGALLAGTVLLAGTGVGVALANAEAWSTAGVRETAPAVLGPVAGADAEASLAASAERAVGLSREVPGTRFLALVSLSEPLDVERTSRLVAGSQLVLRRAYVRAPEPELAELFPVELDTDPARTLSVFFTETARRKTEEQRELAALATDAGAGAGESYEAAARVAGQEAAAYRADCACVLAVVVEGPASELAELLSVPGVRGVDVAPRGARLAELEVRPLPPDVTGPVPASGAGG